MDFSTLLLAIALLACPLAMAGMMWMMSKQMGGHSGHSMASEQAPASTTERLAALRAQREALEAEIAEATRLIELEAQRDALLNGKGPAMEDANAPATRSAD